LVHWFIGLLVYSFIGAVYLLCFNVLWLFKAYASGFISAKLTNGDDPNGLKAYFW